MINLRLVPMNINSFHVHADSFSKNLIKCVRIPYVFDDIPRVTNQWRISGGMNASWAIHWHAAPNSRPQTLTPSLTSQESTVMLLLAVLRAPAARFAGAGTFLHST